MVGDFVLAELLAAKGALMSLGVGLLLIIALGFGYSVIYLSLGIYIFMSEELHYLTIQKRIGFKIVMRMRRLIALRVVFHLISGSCVSQFHPSLAADVFILLRDPSTQVLLSANDSCRSFKTSFPQLPKPHSSTQFLHPL